MTSYFRSFALALIWGTSTIISLAFPTIYGDTGLVLSPTADITPYYQFQVNVGYTNVSSSTGTSAAVPVQLTFGITPNVEIAGFFSEPIDGGEGFEAYGGSAKVALISQDDVCNTPSLSVGARFYRLQDPLDQNVSEGYAVSAFNLLRANVTPYSEGYAIRGHLGVEYRNFSGEESADFFMPFIGISYDGYGSSAALEYLPELEDQGVVFRRSTVSGALRLPISRDAMIQLAATRPFESGDMSIYLSLLYAPYAYGAADQVDGLGY